MKEKRTIGVIILGIFFILWGLLSTSTVFTFPKIQKNLMFFLYGSIIIMVGAGVLFLKEWARIAGLFLIATKAVHLSVNSIKDINFMIKESAPFIAIFLGVILIIIIIAIHIGILYYLNHSKTKARFK